MKKFFLFFFLNVYIFSLDLGVDIFFKEGGFKKFKNRGIALIINQTSRDKRGRSTLLKFLEKKDLKIKAIFTPEHGIEGVALAGEKVKGSKIFGIPCHSLYGKSRRPTSKMLEGIDLLIFDIQDIGSRSYTYISTLFFIMEEASKRGISVVVLDRPNPINGITVDGPMLDKRYRSFVGYINVPYCHGMTVGELAGFFNGEYKIACNLRVIKMRGWKREMSYLDTGLFWIPTSPNIPEADSPFYYPTTGILGELHILNIGIGYTSPFKIVGAPWLDGKLFAKKLNEQKLPGVLFLPTSFKPFYGLYKGLICQGVRIIITDRKIYRPVSTQYIIMGILKSLYPKIFLKGLESSPSRKEMFFKVNGSKKVYEILKDQKFPAWQLIEFQKRGREDFLKKRERYLLY